MKITKGAFFLIFFTVSFNLTHAQIQDIRDVQSQKFRLQNEIKNLIRKKSESQRNVLYLQHEIEETENHIEDLMTDIELVEGRIKKNLKTFIVSYIKEKNNDLDFKSQIEAQIYKNWRKQEDQIVKFKTELEKTLKALNVSKEEMQKFIRSSRSYTYKIETEMSDLERKQKELKTEILSDGPDSTFYSMKQRLRWPVANARLVGSRGFYKIPGESVFDYNEGMVFKAKRNSLVFPIFKGIIEESLLVPELDWLIVVKHTDNIRSFYIGVRPRPDLIKGQTVSPDYEIGFVNKDKFELKLRFDTEALDPVLWVSKRR